MLLSSTLNYSRKDLLKILIYQKLKIYRIVEIIKIDC